MGEDLLDDHFPRRPVMPGVLMIEGMAQASGLLREASLPDKYRKEAKAARQDGPDQAGDRPAALAADPPCNQDLRARVQGPNRRRTGVNGRPKTFWGADDVNVTGAERSRACIGVVMLVHLGLATLLAACLRWAGTLGQTRLSPIAKALQTQIAS